MARAFLTFLLFALTCSHSVGDELRIRQTSYDAPAEPGKQAKDGLPDGRIAVGKPGGTIKSAWYIQPTRRYKHGILGDDIEAGGLRIINTSSKQVTYTLPESQVFEDRTPRLVQLGGKDGSHVITLLSQADKGASIAVFGLVDGQLKLLAQTPYIGRRNRWRNIAGIADFDGDGHLEIAEVVTPHIGGTLRFWTWKKGKLRPVAEMFGFSNHQMGSREQRLSTVGDFDGDGFVDLALPSTDRLAVRIVGFTRSDHGQTNIKDIATINLPTRIDKAFTSRKDEYGTEILIGLDDGSGWAIHR